VVVIGGGDENGVNLPADLVKHLPVIRERLKLGAVLLLVVHRLADDRVALLVGIHDGHQVFAQRRGDM
jgi:hypothetical protein